LKAEDIRVNQLIEIEVEFSSSREYLPSRVEEINDDYLYIAAPTYRGEIVPLRIGQDITICLVHNKDFFVFSTKIVSRKRNPLPLLIVRKPQKLDKIQRRAFVRLSVRMPLYFKVLPDEEEFKEGVTLDISGGGAQFESPAILNKDQLLEIKIKLPEREPVCCKARVVRVTTDTKGTGQGTTVAVEYEDITEGQQDRIINYIFAVQREWIKKGLLD